ncbi:MAG: arginine--tRNA ligase [Candidatus Lokiarchaeota archaeon]|nr:arginine--tRNA ligase [Candidatus Lokiarchaeota archaeon]
MNYEIQIAKIIGDYANLEWKDIIDFVREANPNIDADFAINCYTLRKYLKKDGKIIAKEIHSYVNDKVIDSISFISSVELAGPYLNFKLNKQIQVKDTLNDIFKDIDEFALSYITKEEMDQRIVIEYPSPNTNKPLHLGHIRNMLLGQALSKLCSFSHSQVFQVNLLNDRGVHICKSMWAYNQFGHGSTPKTENMKSDHFVGKYYVKYAEEEAKRKEKVSSILNEFKKESSKQKEERDVAIIKTLEKKIAESDYGQLQAEIKDMLQKWENQDPEVRSLWRKMNNWAEKGFKETFDVFQIKHDKTYYESQIYDKGKDIVYDGLKRGLFEKLEDGAIIANFKKKGLPKKKVLLRSDGTSLYITQDLYLAKLKMQDYNYDLSIYVIGNEQNMQLKTVFELLDRLGMEGKNLHYSYGMINLTSGKMKSREGTVVDADDLVSELKTLAIKEIEERYKDISEKERDLRADVIAMAALRFYILKYEYTRDFLFEPKKSISFEGETGPYILYAYARICSIFAKAKEENIDVPYDPEKDKVNDIFNLDMMDFSIISNEHELNLIDLLYKYPKTIKDATINLKPHSLSRYLFDLAQEYNAFYHTCRVIGEEEKTQNFRLILSDAVRYVLRHGLSLLTIDVLTEM